MHYTDVDTIKRIRKDLQDWKLGRALFVADAGMNPKSNQEELGRTFRQVSSYKPHGKCQGNPGPGSFKTGQIFGLYGKSPYQGSDYRRW